MNPEYTPEKLNDAAHDAGLHFDDLPDDESPQLSEPPDYGEAQPSAKPNKIRLLRGSDLLTPTPIKWLVSGVLEAGVLAAAFGAPASGKSFVAIDLALSIATGRVWNERGVNQGSVVYFAGEGREGVKRRLAAWMQRNPESRELFDEYFGLSECVCSLPSETALVLDTLADVKNLKLVILDTVTTDVKLTHPIN